MAPPEEPAPPAKKQSKITIIPAQPNSERNTTIKSSTNKAKASTDKGSSKLGENGRVESTSSSKPQLERQTRIDKSRSRNDSRVVPLSKSESTTGKLLNTRMEIQNRN